MFNVYWIGCPVIFGLLQARIYVDSGSDVLYNASKPHKLKGCLKLGLVLTRNGPYRFQIHAGIVDVEIMTSWVVCQRCELLSNAHDQP